MGIDYEDKDGLGEETSYAVKSAEEMIKNFVGNVFSEETLNKVLPILEKVIVKIDTDPKIAGQCAGYFDGVCVYI